MLGVLAEFLVLLLIHEILELIGVLDLGDDRGKSAKYLHVSEPTLLHGRLVDEGRLVVEGLLGDGRRERSTSLTSLMVPEAGMKTSEEALTESTEAKQSLGSHWRAGDVPLLEDVTGSRKTNENNIT